MEITLQPALYGGKGASPCCLLKIRKIDLHCFSMFFPSFPHACRSTLSPPLPFVFCQWYLLPLFHHLLALPLTPAPKPSRPSFPPSSTLGERKWQRRPATLSTRMDSSKSLLWILLQVSFVLACFILLFPFCIPLLTEIPLLPFHLNQTHHLLLLLSPLSLLQLWSRLYHHHSPFHPILHHLHLVLSSRVPSFWTTLNKWMDSLKSPVWILPRVSFVCVQSGPLRVIRFCTLFLTEMPISLFPLY